MKSRFILIAALSLFFAASCSVEQSELTLDNMNGTALLTGKVTYDAGSVLEDGGISPANILPASNQTVVVKVSNASYLGDPDMGGYQIFTDTTNAEGMYSIEIPVTETMPVEAEISVVPFKAVWSYDINGGIVTIEDVLYEEIYSTTVSVGNKGIVEEDIMMFTSYVPEMELTESHTVSGTVYLPSWTNGQFLQWEPDKTVTNKEFEFQVELIVDKISESGHIRQYSIEYNIKTDNQGEYEQTVKLPADIWENLGNENGEYNARIIIRNKPLAVNDFLNRFQYVDNSWDSQTVSLLYPQIERVLVLDVNDAVLENVIDFNFLYESQLLMRPTDVYGIGLLEKNGKAIKSSNHFNW